MVVELTFGTNPTDGDAVRTPNLRRTKYPIVVRSCINSVCVVILVFFFNDPAPPEISPLSQHGALPILIADEEKLLVPAAVRAVRPREGRSWGGDRKSTRLKPSHIPLSRMPSSA